MGGHSSSSTISTEPYTAAHGHHVEEAETRGCASCCAAPQSERFDLFASCRSPAAGLAPIGSKSSDIERTRSDASIPPWDSVRPKRGENCAHRSRRCECTLGEAVDWIRKQPGANSEEKAP